MKTFILASALFLLSAIAFAPAPASAFVLGSYGPCTDQAGKPLDPAACAFNAAQRGQVIPDHSPGFIKLYKNTAYGN